MISSPRRRGGPIRFACSGCSTVVRRSSSPSSTSSIRRWPTSAADWRRCSCTPSRPTSISHLRRPGLPYPLRHSRRAGAAGLGIEEVARLGTTCCCPMRLATRRGTARVHKADPAGAKDLTLRPVTCSMSRARCPPTTHRFRRARALAAHHCRASRAELGRRTQGRHRPDGAATCQPPAVVPHLADR